MDTFAPEGFTLDSLPGLLGRGTIVVAIGALLGAVILMIVIHLLFRIRLTYGAAYKMSFVVGFIGLSLSLVYIFFMQTQGNPVAASSPTMTVVGVVASGIVYGMMTRDERKRPIGLTKGLAVAIIMAVLGYILGTLLRVLRG